MILETAYLLTQPRRKLVGIILFQKLQLNSFKRRLPGVRSSRKERLSLTFMARFLKNWKHYLVLVKAETLLDWIRSGISLTWYLKCQFKHLYRLLTQRYRKRGRPPINSKTWQIVDRIVQENPHFGVDSILGELVKLKIQISRSRLAVYLQRSFPDRGSRSRLSWKQFACGLNHAVAAMDFFVVLDFFARPLYCFVLIDHARRKLLHTAATYHPYQMWVIQQLKFAFQKQPRPDYLITDNDTIFVHGVSKFLKRQGIQHIRTSYRSPWQNPVAERVIGTLRRDIFDRTLIVSSQQACELLEEYSDYYNNHRSHLTLARDSPNGHLYSGETSTDSKLKSIPVCDGLVHHYRWTA